MLEFSWVWVFFLLPLPVLCYWLLPHVKTTSDTALKTSLFSEWHTWSQDASYQNQASRIHYLISFIFWCLLLLALSRPQWIGEPIELPASGRDLLISIDVSGSMEQADFSINGRTANRFQAVQHILSDFIERRQGDRLGLILFGERAYLQTPLTFDLTTVRTMLMESEIGLAGKRRTAIGDSIGLAVKRLKDRPEENRVLILLTDGQSNAGEVEPIDAAKLAKVAGVRIYTIGIGSDVQIVNDPFFGKRKINPSKDLDEATLKEVAKLTDGLYFRAKDEHELKNIYIELDKLEPVEVEKETYRPVKELYYYPLILLFIIYCLLLFFQMVTHKKVSFKRSSQHV